MTTQYFSLTIEGQQIDIAYTPNKFSAYGHFEFRSAHQPPRSIPISKTGYLSHFMPIGEIEQLGSPQACAESIIKTLLDSQKKKPKATTKVEMIEVIDKLSKETEPAAYVQSSLF